MYKNIKTALVVAIAYAIAARIGLNWPLLPDENTTIIWPSSGIALAAILLFGRPATAGVLLGALLAFGIEAYQYDSRVVMFNAVLVSIASTLSAYMAASWLTTTYAVTGRWRKATDLVLAQVTIGAACALPAIAAVISLIIANLETQRNLSFYFAIWWLANFLGMVIFCPLIWLAVQYFRGKRGSKLWTGVSTPLAIISFSGIIALTAFLMLWSLERDSISGQLNRAATLAADGVNQALDRAARKLGSIRALFYASEQVMEGEFRRFTEAELGAHLAAPGVQAVGWAPKVTEPEWFSPITEDGGITRMLWERDPFGNSVPVGNRDAYFPVHFIQPLNETNERAVAFDLASEKVRRAALERSRDTGDVSMASPITLVQSNVPVPSILLSVPIYLPEAELSSIEARRDNLTGFATGVYLVRDIFENTRIEESSELDFHLFDESLPALQQWFHSSISAGNGNPATQADAPKLNDLRGDLHGAATLHFAGHTWTVIATPTPDAITLAGPWTPWGAAALLILLGLLTSSISIERFTAEERSREEQQKTENALAQAQAANKSKAYFMAAASHDIKQPLYALSMLTDTLIMSSNQVSSRPLLERLRESIIQMGDHFDALMDMQNYIDGVFKAELVPVPLSEFASRIDLEFAPMCDEKQLTWNLSMDAVTIKTDPELLLRLLRNLLVNAIRNTEAGEIACRVEVLAGRAQFEISDTGSGIDTAEQTKIVEKLRNPYASETQGNGSGMGLSIVARIAVSLHLDVQMRSLPGNGTTFRFQVPIV